MSHPHFTLIHVLVAKGLELNAFPARSPILRLELEGIFKLCDQRVEDGALASIVSTG